MLTEIYGKPPVQIRMGGTVPVCPLFLKELGAYTVSLAFGLEDEQVHAPNEFWRLDSFAKAKQAYGLMFEELAK